MNPLQRVAMLQQQKLAGYRVAQEAPVKLNKIMNAVEKHLKTNHKGLEGWGDWHGDGSLFQCNNESKGLELALEVKASGKDGMQADIQITDDEGEIVVETAQKIHADMTDEASVIEAIHDFMVTQAKYASSHKKHASLRVASLESAVARLEASLGLTRTASMEFDHFELHQVAQKLKRDPFITNLFNTVQGTSDAIILIDKIRSKTITFEVNRSYPLNKGLVYLSWTIKTPAQTKYGKSHDMDIEALFHSMEDMIMKAIHDQIGFGNF